MPLKARGKWSTGADDDGAGVGHQVGQRHGQGIAAGSKRSSECIAVFTDQMDLQLPRKKKEKENTKERMCRHSDAF